MIIKVINGYKVMKENTKNSYVVVNTLGQYENHGHFKKLSTCYLIIDIVSKRKVPKSQYLLESAIRLTTDTKYRNTLLSVQETRSNKQHYYNANKGVRK